MCEKCEGKCIKLQENDAAIIISTETGTTVSAVIHLPEGDNDIKGASIAASAIMMALADPILSQAIWEFYEQKIGYLNDKEKA